MSPKKSSNSMPFTALIAWILVGLMIGSSLVDYLATTQPSSACVELRLLEQEDDRADVTDLVYVVTQRAWAVEGAGYTDDLHESPRLDIWSARQAARYERGPPSLVSAYA